MSFWQERNAALLAERADCFANNCSTAFEKAFRKTVKTVMNIQNNGVIL